MFGSGVGAGSGVAAAEPSVDTVVDGAAVPAGGRIVALPFASSTSTFPLGER